MKNYTKAAECLSKAYNANPLVPSIRNYYLNIIISYYFRINKFPTYNKLGVESLVNSYTNMGNFF